MQAGHCGRPSGGSTGPGARLPPCRTGASTARSGPVSARWRRCSRQT